MRSQNFREVIVRSQNFREVIVIEIVNTRDAYASKNHVFRLEIYLTITVLCLFTLSKNRVGKSGEYCDA